MKIKLKNSVLIFVVMRHSVNSQHFPLRNRKFRLYTATHILKIGDFFTSEIFIRICIEKIFINILWTFIGIYIARMICNHLWSLLTLLSISRVEVTTFIISSAYFSAFWHHRHRCKKLAVALRICCFFK